MLSLAEIIDTETLDLTENNIVGLFKPFFLRINIKGQIAKCLRNEAKIIHIYWSFFCEFSLTVMVFSLTHFRPVFHNPCHTPRKTSKYRNRTLTRNELRMVLLISGVFYRNITLSLNLIS